MKRFRIGILIAIIVLVFSSVPAFAAGTPKRVLDAAKSVVLVESSLGSGSGFVIKKDSGSAYIVTNHHVIGNSTSGLSVWVSKDKRVEVTVAASDSKKDLAILKTVEPIDLPYLSLSENAKQGDEVYAIGFPAAADVVSNSTSRSAEDATITNGIISSVRTGKASSTGTDMQLLQINADINPGNSGGPLLNGKGQVVGINSLGITESQGIFFSISISELITLVKEQNLFSVLVAGTMGWIWFIIIPLAVVLLALIILFMKKKGIKIKQALPQRKRKAAKEISLPEYWERLGNCLDPSSAVTMLMPVLLELRDRHNQGSVFLKLSPRRLMVTKSGCKLSPNQSVTEEAYLAPEQKNGGVSGIRADIYAACAVLRHMLGIDIATGGNIEPTGQQMELERIIRRGMEPDAQNRYPSMQELIADLSAFNNGISEFALEPFATIPSASKSNSIVAGNVDISSPIETAEPTAEAAPARPKEKKKRHYLRWALISAAGLLVAFGGYIGVNFGMMKSAISEFDFEAADDSLNRMLFVSNIFPNDKAFVNVGMLLKQFKFDEAQQAFDDMGGYPGADDFSKEIQYQQAAYLASNQEFEKAITAYQLLKDYKDSFDKYNQTNVEHGLYYANKGTPDDFKKAIDILGKMRNYFDPAKVALNETYYQFGTYYIEQEDYVNAYIQYQKCDMDYKDVKQTLENLSESAYQQSLDNFKNYDNRDNCFEELGDYKDSEKYERFLIAYPLALLSGSENYINFLFDNLDIDGVVNFILDGNYVAVDFLSGTWSNGEYYFQCDEESANWNIPYIESATWEFDHGEFLTGGKKQAHFTVVDRNTINIYVYASGDTYQLYRE